MSTKEEKMDLCHRAGAYRSACGKVLRVVKGEGEDVTPRFLVRRAPKQAGDGEKGIVIRIGNGPKLSISEVTCWGAAEPKCAQEHAEDPMKHLGKVVSFRTTHKFAGGDPFVECIEHDGKVFFREGYVDADDEAEITVMISSISPAEKGRCRVRAKEAAGPTEWRLVPVRAKIDGTEDHDVFGFSKPLGRRVMRRKSEAEKKERRLGWPATPSVESAMGVEAGSVTFWKKHSWEHCPPKRG